MAGSPQTGRQDLAGHWRIDRFELIYYNARHKRWQYFAEDPLISFNDHKNHRDGESPHRRQVRRFLFMVRGAIEQLVSTLKPDCFEVRPRRGGDPNRPIPIHRPSFAGWQKSWDEYLGYLHHSARLAERLPVSDLDALNRCFSDLGTSGTGTHELSRNLSITLLSLLPILEGWDTWGCFLRARKASIQELSPSMHFPPACADADWFEPFYIAEVEYSGASNGTVSAELLGEDVNLEAGCCDLATSAPEFKMSRRADFFEYCRRPEELDGELYLYRCYGHLVDALIKALSGGGDGRRFFFVAYPLQTAGRLHFLQIALTTTDADASVSTLHNDWSDIHGRFWQAECRTMLAAEQERIALSAFQHAAASSLRELATPGVKLTDEALKSVLAENIYNLFPIRFAKASNRSWHYTPDKYEETTQSGGETTQSGVRGCILGYRWQPLEAGPPQYAGTDEKNLIDFQAHSYGIEGKAPRIGNHILQNTLIEQRIVQSIEQQMDYLKSMRYAIEQERRLEEEETRRTGIALVLFLEGLPESEARRIMEARALDDVQDILLSDVPADFSNPHAPLSDSADLPRDAMWYLQMAHRAASSETRLQILQHSLQPSLLDDLSAFFDSSLVKIYTHNFSVDDYFSGTLDDAKVAVSRGGFLRKHFETLAQRLHSVHEKTAETFGRAFEHFADVVQTKITALDDLRYWESPGKNKFSRYASTVGKIRGELQWFWAPPLDADGPCLNIPRFFLPWNLWLGDWLNAYWQRRKRDATHYASGPHFVESRAAALGERFPFIGRDRIRLYEQSLWFPCSVGVDVALNDRANTVVNWSAACQECANLLLVNRDAAGQMILLREALNAENYTSFVNLGSTARSRTVLNDHSARVPKDDALNFWVILYRTWRADEASKGK